MPFTVRAKCRAVEDFVDEDVDANMHSSAEEEEAVEELLLYRKCWADMTKEEKKLMGKYVVQMNVHLRRWQSQLDTYIW